MNVRRWLRLRLLRYGRQAHGLRLLKLVLLNVLLFALLGVQHWAACELDDHWYPFTRLADKLGFLWVTSHESYNRAQIAEFVQFDLVRAGGITLLVMTVAAPQLLKRSPWETLRLSLAVATLVMPLVCLSWSLGLLAGLDPADVSAAVLLVPACLFVLATEGVSRSFVVAGAWRSCTALRSHVCLGCGYDLRGATSDRCSECGLRANEAHPRLQHRFRRALGMMLWQPTRFYRGYVGRREREVSLRFASKLDMLLIVFVGLLCLLVGPNSLSQLMPLGLALLARCGTVILTTLLLVQIYLLHFRWSPQAVRAWLPFERAWIVLTLLVVTLGPLGALLVVPSPIAPLAAGLLLLVLLSVMMAQGLHRLGDLLDLSVVAGADSGRRL